jgi:hypothetical protein
MYNAAVAVEATAETSSAYQPATAYSFEIGQCVTHTDQPLPSLVMWRGKGGDPKQEIYGIRSYLEGDTNRDRLVMGDKLRRAVPHSVDCRACTLYGSGRCPGLLDSDADESLLAAE